MSATARTARATKFWVRVGGAAPSAIASHSAPGMTSRCCPNVGHDGSARVRLRPSAESSCRVKRTGGATNGIDTVGFRQRTHEKVRPRAGMICQSDLFRTVLLSQLAKPRGRTRVLLRHGIALAHASNAAQHEQHARCRSAAREKAALTSGSPWAAAPIGAEDEDWCAGVRSTGAARVRDEEGRDTKRQCARRGCTLARGRRASALQGQRRSRLARRRTASTIPRSTRIPAASASSPTSRAASRTRSSQDALHHPAATSSTAARSAPIRAPATAPASWCRSRTSSSRARRRSSASRCRSPANTASACCSCRATPSGARSCARPSSRSPRRKA